MTDFSTDIERFHQDLSKSYREYWYGRGVEDATLDKMKIGYKEKYNSGFYVFPYFNGKGECYSYREIAADDKKKQYWYPVGAGDVVRIYNIADISRAKETGETLFMGEGEKDSLILIQCGYLCIGIPGVNAFKEKDIELFDGVKDIVVCFDKGRAGREGSRKVANLLGRRARVLIWPEKCKEGYDVNDLWLGR